jgi:2-hydroxychromene-2-carboxylate isomerase
MSERVTVCVDFKNPHAWLAIAPTRALEQRLGTPFDWRPRSVAPIAQPTPLRPGASRGERHRSIRAAYWVSDLERYAKSRGIALRDPWRALDTTLPSLALLRCRKTAPEQTGWLAERLFDALWRDGLSSEALAAQLELGEYAKDEGPDELAANEAELEALGVWNVPAYLVHGELFMGRQHLPMVEWLATGRSGPPPI